MLILFLRKIKSQSRLLEPFLVETKNNVTALGFWKLDVDCIMHKMLQNSDILKNQED